MKTLFTILLFLPSFIHGQSVLDKIKSNIQISGQGNDICEQSYIRLGSILEGEKTYVLYEVMTSFGPSCKQNNKLVITQSEQIVGFYYTLGIRPQIRPDGRIQWNFEDGKTKLYSTIKAMGFKDYPLESDLILKYRSLQ